MEEVEEKGLENLVVSKGLNDHPDFIQALSDEVLAKLAHELPVLEENMPTNGHNADLTPAE